MVVVDHQPNECILLRRGNESFIEVTSSISFLPISIIVKLNDEQIADIADRGRVAIQSLAYLIAESWLACGGEVSSDDEAAVNDAIRSWSSASAA